MSGPTYGPEGKFFHATENVKVAHQNVLKSGLFNRASTIEHKLINELCKKIQKSFLF